MPDHDETKQRVSRRTMLRGAATAGAAGVAATALAGVAARRWPAPAPGRRTGR